MIVKHSKNKTEGTKNLNENIVRNALIPINTFNTELSRIILSNCSVNSENSVVLKLSISAVEIYSVSDIP